MKYNKDIHKRKSLRLKGYNYSQKGLYFITIGVNGKINLFGEIQDGELILNNGSKIVEYYWKELENKYKFIQLHEFIIMPNHFHGIIEIIHDINVGADLCVCPKTGNTNKNDNIQTDYMVNGLGSTHRLTPTGGEYLFNKNSVSEIIKWFKVMSTNAYIKQVHLGKCKPFDKKLWQRNYYEHIIRNESSYNHISEYIINNPKKWEQDELYN